MVADRLSSFDVSLLSREASTSAMHVGGLAIVQPPEGGFDHDRLVELISARISLVPRFRQKVRGVPGRLAGPVWADDEAFDLHYHVRRCALPRPGTDAQLRELVGRLQSRPLDRAHPLWEISLIEGLAEGRMAVVTKTHHAMVDGFAAVDLATVLFDRTPCPRDIPADDWTPARRPGGVSLLAGALGEVVRRPGQILDSGRAAVNDVRGMGGRAVEVVGDLVSTARGLARQAPDLPLNAPTGWQRRFAMAATDLDDFKRVSKAYGGTVNDVVLAVVSGALRNWLLTRGEPVRPATIVRAMVPVSVRAEAGALTAHGQAGNRVAGYLVDLPVGEANAVIRLYQVTYAMRGHRESGSAVRAHQLTQLSGFAPPTIHSLGARVASQSSRRLFNVVVSNVPGPQFPLYAGRARMLQMYPVVPLARGQVVSVGVTSYDGRVFFGLNADRKAMPDVDGLAGGLQESLADLVGTLR